MSKTNGPHMVQRSKSTRFGHGNKNIVRGGRPHSAESQVAEARRRASGKIKGPGVTGC